jgi:hypothetical protein
MKNLLLSLALLSAASPAFAAQCHPDMIRTVSSSGAIIAMSSGQVFKVYPGQGPKAVFWQPLDKLNVCPLGGAAYTLTNLSTKQKANQVNALRTKGAHHLHETPHAPPGFVRRPGAGGGLP